MSFFRKKAVKKLFILIIFVSIPILIIIRGKFTIYGVTEGAKDGRNATNDRQKIHFKKVLYFIL